MYIYGDAGVDPLEPHGLYLCVYLEFTVFPHPEWKLCEGGDSVLFSALCLALGDSR